MNSARIFRKTLATLVALTMLNSSLYSGLAMARDSDIYLTTTYAGDVAEPNILIVLDTSDSMNIPEAWREFPGDYDSHVEYMSNDTVFMNKVSVLTLPPDGQAQTPFGHFGPPDGFGEQVLEELKKVQLQAAQDAATAESTNNIAQAALATAQSALNVAQSALADAQASLDADPSNPALIAARDAAQAIRDDAQASFDEATNNANATATDLAAKQAANTAASQAVTDAEARNVTDEQERADIKAAALNYANKIELNGAGPDDPGARNQYRNYGTKTAPHDFWLWWVPAGTPDTDPRFRSLGTNRFRGTAQVSNFSSLNGSANPVVRGGISFGNAEDFTQLNQCGSSYDDLIPSTVFAPSAQPRNNGFLLGERWKRWEEYLDLDTVNLSSYPGSNTDVSGTSVGTVKQGYLDQHRDDTRISGNIRGSAGQPIRKRDVGDSFAGWTDLNADMAQYTEYRDRIDTLGSALDEVMSRYGLTLVGTPADKKFQAWKGNRDAALTAFGNHVGTPGYVDALASVTATAPGSTTCTATRTCGFGVDVLTDGIDGSNVEKIIKGSCAQTAPPSGGCPPPDPAACAASGGTQNFVNANFRNCNWAGRQNALIEGVGIVYHGGVCRGECRGPFCPAALNGGENYCNESTSGTLVVGANTFTKHRTDSATAGCSAKSDVQVTCQSKNPSHPGCKYNQQCNNQTITVTIAGGGLIPFDVFNRDRVQADMFHECLADNGTSFNPGSGSIASAKRAFDADYNAFTSGANASYTTSAASAVSTGPAIDVYHPNYLNWRFGAKACRDSAGDLITSGAIASGATCTPIGRKTRLQTAKDALVELVDLTNGVRFGLMVFNNLPSDPSLAAGGSQGGNVQFKITRMGSGPSDPDFANRAPLKAKISNLIAKAATPLTETTFEAHQYFNGGVPLFGTLTDAAAGGGTVSDGRDVTALSGGNYVSPMLDNPQLGAPAACQKNYLVLITDGGPDRDIGADSKIQALSQTVGLAPSTTVVAARTTVDDTNADTLSEQFETLGAPFAPESLNDPAGSFVWLDELAYYMAGADLATLGALPGIQPVFTYTVGFAGVASP
ncbi:MAG: hypothetical protein ACREUA_00935, partial [Burkholderiales bacterium]